MPATRQMTTTMGGDTAAFRRSRRVAKGSFEPSGVFVELPGMGTCFYRQAYAPGRPTLLLAHGMVASSGLNWFRLFPALSGHFNLVAPDMRGHGRSWRGNNRFSLEAAADDMAELIEAIDCGPVIGVGYSMGGAVVQYLWRRHPEKVRGLVLAATNYRARVARHEEMFALPFFALMVGIGNLTELVGHLPKGLIKRFLPRLADQLHEDDTRWALDELRRTSISMVAQTGREMALHDAGDWLHEVDVPTAVVCTGRDRAVPPAHQREMAALIPGCEVFDFDDGHLACVNPAFGEALLAACRNVHDRAEAACIA